MLRLRSGRLSGKKKPTQQTSWHRPLSARNEHQSHPLAGQAQACGRLIRRMDRGPDGTCRDHWLLLLLKKKFFPHFLRISSRCLHCMSRRVCCARQCQLCGILLWIVHGKRCWTNGSPPQHVEESAASDRSPAESGCLMLPAMWSTHHGTCAVCSATKVHACSVSERTGIVTIEKVRQNKNKQE